MHIRWRGLELPSKLDCDSASLSSTYGKFICEPFERGFGSTVGNSLRRVLLSSLEGSAVTQIKISGVQHEFAAIPGVVEDVTEIVLNVKSLVVKNHSDSTRVITVEKSQAGLVTGGRANGCGRRGHQQGPRDRHVNRQRPVHDGNGGRKWSWLCSRDGTQRRRT